MKLIRITAAMVMLLTVVASCSVDGDDKEVVTQDPDKMLLQSITSTMLNQSFYKIEYDGQSRPIAVQSVEGKLVLSYNPLSMVETTTDEYYDSNSSSYVGYVNSKIEYTNVQLNADGYIATMDVTKTKYEVKKNYSYEANRYEYSIEISGTEGYTVRNTYSALGELEMAYVDNDNFTVYNWSNGLLTDITRRGEDGSTVIKYSGKKNVNRQWDPMTGIYGLFTATKLLGVAPARWIDRIDDGGSVRQFSYTLNDVGLIEKSQYNTPDGNIALKYNYVAIK